MRYLIADAWVRVIVALCVCVGGCKGNTNSPTGPPSPSSSSATNTPAPHPPFDMLDYMAPRIDHAFAATGAAFEALPIWWVGPDRWVECKFGDCAHHEALRADADWIYLDEDHSMNGNADWFVYTLGKWARRRWEPGQEFYVSHFSAWYQNSGCRRNIEGHEILYKMRFEEHWRSVDFGGDLGVRDAVVISYSPDLPEYRTGKKPTYATPEYNVYAFGAGRVYWSYARPSPTSSVMNKKISKPGNPQGAVTCVWAGGR